MINIIDIMAMTRIIGFVLGHVVRRSVVPERAPYLFSVRRTICLWSAIGLCGWLTNVTESL